MRKFNDLMNAANNFKGNLKVYMFLKDCAFRSIFNFFQNGQLTQSEKQNIQNLYGQFQNEINQYNWKISIMPLNEYQQFLNEFYSKNNFESADINTLIMAKELTENLSIFGNYDDVTKRRLDYFSNKIKSMQQMNMMNQNQMGGYSTNQYQNQQQIPQMNYNNIQTSSGGGMVNNNIGSFYDPNKTNYVPELVNLTFQLPIRRNDSNFPNLKVIIEDLIENATQELDYHKVDMTRKNLEAAAYYISKIID